MSVTDADGNLASTQLSVANGSLNGTWLGWRSEVVIEPLRNSLREKP